MTALIKRGATAITLLSLLVLTFITAGCGGGNSGLSSQVVSGTASVGAPLAGQVSLKDSAATPQVKTTVIAADGSFAIDVTDMTAPFILEATGTAAGVDYKLHSFAEGAGTANVNPLTEAIVASASDDGDASEVYSHANHDRLHHIGNNLQGVVNILLSKLQPLLQQYDAQHSNPITSRYIANHLGLDEMFDNMKITVSNGVLSITYTRTGQVIFTGTVTDIANGVYSGGTAPPPITAPAAPAGVTATGGTAQVSLAWAATSTATAYDVYYSTSPGVTTATGTKIQVTGTSYVQTGLTAGTTYYYVITALNSAGEGSASAEVSATTAAPAPGPTVPAVPTGVTAVGGTKQVTVSWPAVSGATSYNIYYATTSGVTATNGTKLSNATSPAVQMGLADGTTYYYVVTAVNSAGESAASVQVAATTLAAVPAPTAPAAPTGVSATGGTNQVTVTWPAVSGATSYNIYWATATGVTKTSGTRIAGATSPYVQTGLTAGTTYYYVVTAVNSVGESVASTQASATTAAPAPAVPAAPAGVSAVGGTNQVTVSWSAVSGATSYNIYYGTATGVTKANGTKITGATSPYVQTGLTAGTAYYYVVTAVNATGEGAASTQATATTASAAPAFDALAYYNSVCLGCHGSLGKRTAAQISSAISGIGSMRSLSTLTSAQISAIAAVSY